MRKIITVLSFFLTLLCINVSHGDSKVSFGTGFGALYSGIGVNVGLRSKNNFGYIAAGCIGIGRSDNSGWLTPCGVGVGWIWSGLFSNSNNRHGIGVYLGPVGIESNSANSDNNDAIYGAGITYIYFMHGINSAGWIFGLTPTIGKDGGSIKGGLLLNAGYHF